MTSRYWSKVSIRKVCVNLLSSICQHFTGRLRHLIVFISAFLYIFHSSPLKKFFFFPIKTLCELNSSKSSKTTKAKTPLHFYQKKIVILDRDTNVDIYRIEIFELNLERTRKILWLESELEWSKLGGRLLCK